MTAVARSSPYESWRQGTPCSQHELEWCARCKPTETAQAPLRPPKTKKKVVRRPANRGRVWVPPPKTPHPYWDAVEARTSTRSRPEVERRVAPWQIDRGLRPWQVAALDAWETNGRRGVVEAATGTGKTMVAMAAAASVRAEHGVCARVVVVVPTQALARQWANELTTTLRIDPSLVGEEHSAAPAPSSRAHVIVMVINSARSRIEKRVVDWERGGNRVLVIVDECHRAGSDHNAQVVRTAASYTLGLSATPERADGGHSRTVYPGLGDPVYRYPLLRALDDGVLAPLRSVNLYVDLTGPERERWDSIGRDLRSALATLEDQHPGITTDPMQMWVRISRLAHLDDSAAKRVVALVARRKALLSGSFERQRCTEAVLAWLAGGRHRAMVFHETIEAAEGIADGLAARGARVVLDHSAVKREDRRRNLERFRRDAAQFLVAVRSLDEGIDVPDASVAVIAAGSRSQRQRIQRLGRTLRASEGKEALAITILVRDTPEETRIGGGDATLLGRTRVVHHRWPGRSVADSVKDASSYRPAQTRQDKVEALLAAALELVTPRTDPVVSSPTTGGYVATAKDLALNAWHPVAAVREVSGMPPDEFDRLRPGIRLAYRLRLDPRRVDDESVIHGSEIEAIVRQWQARRGRR